MEVFGGWILCIRVFILKDQYRHHVFSVLFFCVWFVCDDNNSGSNISNNSYHNDNSNNNPVIMVIMMMVTMLIMAMVSVLHLDFLVPIERYVHPKKMCLQKVFPAYFLSISYVKTNWNG